MGIPIIFIIVVIFIIVLQYKLNTGRKEHAEKMEAYYEREERAQSVRRMPLDDVKLYELNINQLPFEVMRTDDTIEVEKDILRLSALPMASFRGMDNTDLKLKYGIANLNTLIQYEATYNSMLECLIHWADLLNEGNYINEATQVLEEGIRLETDISKNYLMLLNIYEQDKNFDKLKELGQLIKKRDIVRKNLVLEKYNVIQKEYGLRSC